MKKFELTGEVKFHLGIKLYRIKALISFGNVEAGELGGFIEKEENLSQNGNARVSGNAMVYGDARVSGNAMVYGDAWVSGNAMVYGDAWVKVKSDILTIGLIGSRNDTTTFFKTKDKKINVCCGCFRGTIEEFEKAVEETHGGSFYEKQYKIAIELAKISIR